MKHQLPPVLPVRSKGRFRKYFKPFRLYTLLTLIAANALQAQLPEGKSLLKDGLTGFMATGPGAEGGVTKMVSVTGQSFTKAIQVNTFNSKLVKSEYGLKANLVTPLHKGDVLWISFEARSLESKRETGESFVELRLDQLVNGKYQWPPHLERGISIGSEWTKTSIPFIITKDAQPDDVQLVIKFDTYPQRFELGPVSFMNYGTAANVNSLPKSIVHYGGDAPDAAWRMAAAERIEKYRKGTLLVKVVDKRGKPMPGVVVEVHMRCNAFAFGTATSSGLLLDTSTASKIYRDTLLRYFNKVVFENEMKSKNWSKFDYNRTAKAVDWLKLHHMPVRGHVMVWPSWQHAGPVLDKLKNDTAALRHAILKLIKEQATTMKGAFTEWDVVNEPYAHHQFMDLLGRAEMVAWFKAAREYAPGVKLFLNEYTMFQSDVASQSFYDNIKYLSDNGAPINAIGEQGHIGGTPPAIEKVLERLDKFAAFGLPIQISEFDINSDDDDFKARYMADFMTAVYSHPSVVGFMQWGFWAGSHWFPSAALWDNDWNLRVNGKVFTKLVGKTWRTDVEGYSGTDGMYKIRGFTGEYEIVVRRGGKAVKQQTILGSEGATVTVKF